MVRVCDEPPDNFRDVDVYPTVEEILGARKFVRKNIIDGGFSSVNEYLDIQFRLLREDFVANLREALESYQKKNQGRGMEIYKDIKIRCGRDRALKECLKIDVALPKDDKNDKKFMKGSLLLFTKDKFREISLAKVVQKLADKEEVIIELIEPSNCAIGASYTMAESSQYFDPYYNVLSAIQSLPPHAFPMEKYIVSVDSSSVYMPSYLLKPGLVYEIDNHRFAPEMIPRISSNLLGLNTTQFRAFKAALTQEFVVIQGPPGTGKTHLGVKIATTLVQNSHLWHKNTPLLVVSHKNDALDQFLEGLLPITTRLVRVGGQSKSEKLKQFNLTNEKRNGEFQRRPQCNYLPVMQQALVVGMTTSIAARWRDYMQDLKPPIVIVEEAAEVLEGHVIAALTHHCKHLILMGDHQQLQPISADHKMGKEYHLGISLFERMVRNRVQHFQLTIQHRMRPEISELLRVKIYTFLEDHESVLRRPNIQGVAKNVFFMDHNHPEETVNFTTKKNSFEADFLARFAKYLVNNGYNKGEVVILATYAAQLQELEKLVANSPILKSVRISTLDGFQGQESDIVLLSLVRSDEIGFLGKENRVCVALSRAKNGLYILGNMGLLARSSRLWATLKKCLHQRNAFGSKLTLQCQNHGNTTEIQALEDFYQVQNGGCNLKCGSRLDCGHICSLLCHNEGMKHKCEKDCFRADMNKAAVSQFSNLWREPVAPPRRRQMEPEIIGTNLWREPLWEQPIATISFMDTIINCVREFWNRLTRVFR